MSRISQINSKTDNQLRIIVLGYMVRGPLGGLAWHHLQYVIGLAQLGHDVYFLEDSDDYPSCYDPSRGITDHNPTYGIEFACRTFERVGLGDRWAYYDAHSDQWLGPAKNKIREICATADLVLNVSGVNPLRPWLMEIPNRVLIDTDPAFTQIRHLTNPTALELAKKHTTFLSFGENIGLSGCKIPQDGLPWQATRQPIFLNAWPVTPASKKAKFTTVMQWDSYSTKEFKGISYGMKSQSFTPYLEIPLKTEATFELALGSASAPRDLLLTNGWHLQNPLEVTLDCWTYQHYLQQSKGEFSVAKQGYVISNSGWFSERSACYLASGRPVLVEDTGFSQWLETGSGVIAFTSPEEALAGIEEVNQNYEFHSRAAREIAETYFDSNQILNKLLG